MPQLAVIAVDSPVESGLASGENLANFQQVSQPCDISEKMAQNTPCLFARAIPDVASKPGGAHRLSRTRERDSGEFSFNRCCVDTGLHNDNKCRSVVATYAKQSGTGGSFRVK